MITNKDLKCRILELSYKNDLSHLSSTLTSVDIINSIFEKKKKSEPFILSNGHAGLALYVVLERYQGLSAQKLLDDSGIHPDRPNTMYENGDGLQSPIDASTGSLGHGIGIAVGMALANRNQNVYCLVSDGECTEGSVNEALKIAVDNDLFNLKVYVNNNGFSAYRRTQPHQWVDPLTASYLKIQNIETDYVYDEFPFIYGIDGHYVKLDKETYHQLMGVLK